MGGQDGHHSRARIRRLESSSDGRHSRAVNCDEYLLTNEKEYSRAIRELQARWNPGTRNSGSSATLADAIRFTSHCDRAEKPSLLPSPANDIIDRGKKRGLVSQGVVNALYLAIGRGTLR